MPYKNQRKQLKKQLQNRKLSGAHRDEDPSNESASRIITFGSMPSYREDKMQEMKRQKESRKDSVHSQTEAEQDIDETSQFIELSPNNLSKMSHHIIAPEKGILKHIPGGTPEPNHQERWSDLTQSDNQENQSDNRNSDTLTDVERTLKSLNGYHEEILEALQSASANRLFDGRPSPSSDADKKAFLDSIPEYGGENTINPILDSNSH